VSYSRVPYWPLNTCLYVKDFLGNDPRFAYYLLRTLDFKPFNVGSAQPSLNRNHINPLPLLIPSVQEQRTIARILGALDDKIDLNRRMNQTLEAMARALFKSWFVDFEPVQAKAAGRQPFGMDAETAALFPSRFVQSELGPIPEEWNVLCVGDGFRLTMGQSPPGDTYNEVGKGLPFYQGRADFGSRSPALRVYCSAPTRRAGAGDTLVTVRAPVGAINVATRECAIGRGVAAVRHRSGARSFTFYQMDSLSAEFAVFEGEGTLFGAIGREAFEGLKYVEPPPQTLALAEDLLRALDGRLEEAEAESDRLAALRNELLPKLLSGEIRVRDAEREAEGVL
jgi:type I restriction enzyme S subunit